MLQLCCEDWTSMVHFVLNDHTYCVEKMHMFFVWVMVGSVEAPEVFQPPVETFVSQAKPAFEVAQLFGITKAGQRKLSHVGRLCLVSIDSINNDKLTFWNLF